MPLRIVRPLTYVLTIIVAALAFFFMTSQVFAASPTMTATTSDTNFDGTVDAITISFSESAKIVDGNAGNGLSSLALSNGCTIANFDYASAGTMALALNGLTGCTANKTDLTPSVTYTAVANCSTAGAICDAPGTNQMANLQSTVATDGSAPVMLAVAFTSSTGAASGVAVNRVSFTYSEPMLFSNGASINLGGLTSAGTFLTIGTFATAGNVTVPTINANTISGSGTDTLSVDLADQSGGYLASTSSTAPSGVVTPAVGSAFLTESAASHLQVNSTNHPTAGSAAAWDLTAPSLSTATLADLSGNNGKVDTTTLVFNSTMRGTSFSDAQGLMTALGPLTRTGTFAANNTTTHVFTTTLDTLAVNTAATAADFTYGTGGNKLTDLAGNLLASGPLGPLAVAGQIASGDVVESDGANPIVTAATMSSATGTNAGVAVNRLTFTYSESMTVAAGASSATRGDMTTAGTVAGFGTFGTTGDMTVPTNKNTVGGDGTANIYVEFADQAGGYMTTVASPGTTVGGTFTPVASVFVTDAATLQVNTGATTTASGSGWDLTRPTVSSVTIADVAGAVQNGKVDRATIVLNSSMRDSNVTAGDFLLGGATHTGTLTTGTANDATTRFDLTADSLAVDTSTTTGQLTYTGLTTKMTDLAGNLVDTATDGTIVNADIAETDGAAPVLIGLSPVDGAVSVAKTAVVTITFSEIVSSMTFSVVGQAVADYTKNTAAAAVTLTPLGSMASGYHTITVLTAPDAAANAYAGVANGSSSNITNPFHFTVLSSTSSTIPAVASYSMLVNAPNGGEALVSGATQEIAWSSSQTNSSAMSSVNIAYTTDNGATYTTIVNNEINDGTYSWIVPSITSSAVKIKVTGTDLVSELASDTSDSNFSIATSVVTAPATDEEGVSPITGLLEDISSVAYGDYIKSPSYSTVYYVDYSIDSLTLIRRPFNDAQTYLTYLSNFNNVMTVTDATLPTLSLGTPMIPKPGVVLVKIQSVNKVYAIDTAGQLRWVTTEALASSIYGSNWSNYVIDIPDTLYPSFKHGSDITTDEDIDISGMKTRAEVNL